MDLAWMILCKLKNFAIYSLLNFQTRFSRNHVFEVGTQDISKTNEPIAIIFFCAYSIHNYLVFVIGVFFLVA